MSAATGVTALCSHSDLNLMDTYFVSILTENTGFFLSEMPHVLMLFLFPPFFFFVSSTSREQIYFSLQGQIKQKFEIICSIGCWVFKQAALSAAPPLSSDALLEL